MRRPHFRLTCVAQKRLCLSSLSSCLTDLFVISGIGTVVDHSGNHVCGESRVAVFLVYTLESKIQQDLDVSFNSKPVSTFN